MNREKKPSEMQVDSTLRDQKNLMHPYLHAVVENFLCPAQIATKELLHKSPQNTISISKGKVIKSLLCRVKSTNFSLTDTKKLNPKLM